MTLLRLNRLPTPADMTMLGCVSLTQFIEQFNANLTEPHAAKVELLHEGQTIALGDIAWEHAANTWYHLDTMATSSAFRSLSATDGHDHRELLTVTRDDHAQYTVFKIESTPSRHALSMQCFVTAHHADRLAERIRELTHKGYFDPHPLAIDKLGQLCDVLLVGDRLVKCRTTLDRLMSKYYAPDASDTPELDAIINSVEARKERQWNLPRLTPAQKSCLIEVFTRGEFLCPPNYRAAADILIQAGLIDVEVRHFGQRYLRKNNATVEYVRGL